MKQIKIGNITQPDLSSPYINRRKYSFYYNYKRVYNSNLRELQNYIADVNRKLTLYYNELNISYIRVFEMYRLYYSTRGAFIFKKFILIENRFVSTFKIHESTNGCFFVFQNAKIIINELLTILNEFLKIEKQKRVKDKNIFIKSQMEILRSLDEKFTFL